VVKRFVVTVIFILLAAGLASCTLPGKKVRESSPSALSYSEGNGSFALSGMESEVAKQVNDLRMHPREWADYLAGLKPGPVDWIMRRDNPEAMGEAINFLKSMKPRPPLAVSKGLSLAAAALVKDHGPKGLTGHRGSDGKDAFYRMNSYGFWDEKAGENLYYGYNEPDKLIMALLTEGGSQGLEQRRNVFSDDFHYIGIACGAHNVYGTMCVMDFARKYSEVP
jgi:uncharacterized protein YkwD